MTIPNSVKRWSPGKECAVALSVDESKPARDLDRHFRRAVVVGALLIAIAAAIFYVNKAGDGRSAFIRWRHQVLDFVSGVNIYDAQMFPNPPIMPLTLYPLMVLPPVAGAFCWFVLKVALTAVSVWFCFEVIRPPGRPLASWIQAGILFFSLRPILSDLHHGNNNLVILFLIVATFQAWRKGYDALAGLILALAITYKVTPALFVPYFAYKRSWRTVGATALGMGIFLLIVPSLMIGPQFNGECLGMWWHKMLSPYLTRGVVGDQEMNQSMVGVLTRLSTAPRGLVGPYARRLEGLNLVAWAPRVVIVLVKLLSLFLVGMLAVLCRTRVERRTDPRLLGEVSLVVLTMLFVSERSWKHHYVTLLLPYTYLMYEFALARGVKMRDRVLISVAIWGSVLFMATTSNELGSVFAREEAHKIAQGYGMFLWAGVALYVATAWRVWVERNRINSDRPAGTSQVATVPLAISKPHFARKQAARLVD
jgi:alpha-1,2-mannosyltransferase